MFGSNSCPARSTCCRPACGPKAFSASIKRIGMRTISGPSKFPAASGSSSATIAAIPSIRATSVLSIRTNTPARCYKLRYLLLRQQIVDLIVELLLLLIIMFPRSRPAETCMDLFDLTLLIHKDRRRKIGDIIQLGQSLRGLLGITHRNPRNQHRIFNIESLLE